MTLLVKAKEVIYVLAYCELNVGDDLFLKILFERYPDKNFVIVARKEYAKIFAKYKNVTVISINLMYKILNKMSTIFLKKTVKEILVGVYDNIVEIGGSIFMEPNRRSFDPKDKKAFFVIGSNYGPAKTLDYYEYCKKYFSHCTDVCLRDEKSYNLFSSLPNVRYAPDVVFSLELDHERVKKPIAIISPIDLLSQEHNNISKYYQNYISLMVSNCQDLIDKGVDLHFVSFCESQHDDQACNKIISGLKRASDIKVHHYSGDIDSLLALFQSARYVVGTRFHSVVLGLLSGADVMPIVYSNKTSNLLDDLGFSDYQLINKINLKRKAQWIKLDNKECIKLRELAQNQFKGFDYYFN